MYEKQDNKQYVVIIYFSKFDEDQSTSILDMISLKYLYSDHFYMRDNTKNA